MLRNRPPARLLAALACLAALIACSEYGAGAVPVQTSWLEPPEPSPFRSYEAAEFFGAARFRAPPAHGLAFDADADRVPISSDASGVSDARVLHRDDGRLEPPTRSTDDAILAQTFFPADDRLLVRRARRVLQADSDALVAAVRFLEVRFLDTHLQKAD